MKRTILILFVLILPVVVIWGQHEEVESRVYNDNIKSVKIHRFEWNLSYPVINLNSNEKLILQFDLLGNDVQTYYYTFIHCDREWNQSDIYPSDYLQGFSENQIIDYGMSFNTTTNFIHYSLTFPNEDISFKASGNYIVKVFPIGDPDNPVLTSRFMISENIVKIDAKSMRSQLAASYSTGQQVEFTVDYPGALISDPYRTVFASVLQNGRWDNAKKQLKPNFIGNNKLVFNDISGKLLFDAGHEFRYFDIKSIRYQSEYIRAIAHEMGNYHVYLMPSENRSGSQYFYHKDFNGKYYTAIQEGRDQELESDFVYVYFTLPSVFPVPDADVYIYGALSGWSLNNNNRMVYNQETQNYECTMLLKQGWYNFIFVVADSSGNLLKDQAFESDHFDTENDYLILLYLSDPMGRFDRLIGTRITNSLNNQN